MCSASSILKTFLPVVIILGITLSHPVKKSSAISEDILEDEVFPVTNLEPPSLHSQTQKQSNTTSSQEKLKISVDDPVFPPSNLFGLMMPELFLPIDDLAELSLIQDEELSDLPSSPPYNPNQGNYHQSMEGVSRPFTLAEQAEAITQRLRNFEKENNIAVLAPPQTLQKPYNKSDLLKPIKTQHPNSQKVETNLGTLQNNSIKVNSSLRGVKSNEIPLPMETLELMSEKATHAYIETLKEHPSLYTDITNLAADTVDKIPKSLQALYTALEKTRGTKTLGSELRRKFYSAVLGLGAVGSTKDKDAVQASNVTSTPSAFFVFPWSLGLFPSSSQSSNNTNTTLTDLNGSRLDSIFQNIFKKIQQLMANGFSGSKNSTTESTVISNPDETQKEQEHLPSTVNKNESIPLETPKVESPSVVINDSNEVSQIDPKDPSVSSNTSISQTLPTLPDPTPLPAPDLETVNNVIKPILASVAISLDQFIANEYPNLFKPVDEPSPKNHSLSPQTILSLDLTTDSNDNLISEATDDSIENKKHSLSPQTILSLDLTTDDSIENPSTEDAKNHSLSPLTILSVDLTPEDSVENPSNEDLIKNTSSPVHQTNVLKPFEEPIAKNDSLSHYTVLCLNPTTGELTENPNKKTPEELTDNSSTENLVKNTSSPVYAANLLKPFEESTRKNHSLSPQTILSIDLTPEDSVENASIKDSIKNTSSPVYQTNILKPFEEPITKNDSLSPQTILSIDLNAEDSTKNIQTPSYDGPGDLLQHKSNTTEGQNVANVAVKINTISNEDYLELLNEVLKPPCNSSQASSKPYETDIHQVQTENSIPPLDSFPEKLNSSSENTISLAIIESEASPLNPSIHDQKPLEDKAKPRPARPSPASGKKPRPVYGIPHHHHQHSKNSTEADLNQPEPFLNNFNPFGLIPGWLIPSFKWPSFSKILQDILNNRNKEKNSGSSLRFGIENNCEDEMDVTSETLNANGSTLLRHDTLKVTPICQSDSKKSLACSSFCTVNGFVSGSCINEDSCNCHLSEDETKFGLVFTKYSSSTDSKNTTSSNSVLEEECLKCSCSSNCQKAGAYIGYCGNGCYCGVPWYDGTITL